MSSNFLFNNIDVINKKYPNKIDIYENTIKEMLKNKKNINKITKKLNKNYNPIQNKKKLITLEKSYKNSLVLLEMIKKQTEKNILKKYNIEENSYKIVNKTHSKNIQNILMKKKFLTTPLYTFLTTQ